MKRITKDVRYGHGSVTYVVREYSFNMNLGVVRVKVYTSAFPDMYELFEFSDSRKSMHESYYFSTDKELYDDYFRHDYGTLPRPKVRTLSRPKYFGKNGLPLTSYRIL